MTLSLTRFEMRSVTRWLAVLWGALLAMSILMCIILAISGLGSVDTIVHSPGALALISEIIKGISWVLYVGIFTAVIVLTACIVILRFYRGLLGEEGYLMHTLPVREWQLITAKGIAAACAVIGSLIAAVISLILIGSAGDLISVAQGFREFGRAVAQEPLLILLILEAVILVILGILKSIYQIYAAIAVGQLMDRHRVMACLGAYIGITIVLSIVSGIIIFIATVTGAAESFGRWVESVSMTGTGLSGFGPSQVIALLMFLAEAVQLAAFHVLTERLLTKHLNLL